MSDNKISVILKDEERQPCEVWTRVMGYHRPVADFNNGKKSEHADRAYFTEKACSNATCSTGEELVAA
ncbi:MAG: hypothetical protein GY804_07725 [Alphaproteobacteria bacterium]|nr:hypothetical protein [Alphaproteobacteria bacterium]